MARRWMILGLVVCINSGSSVRATVDAAMAHDQLQQSRLREHETEDAWLDPHAGQNGDEVTAQFDQSLHIEERYDNQEVVILDPPEDSQADHRTPPRDPDSLMGEHFGGLGDDAIDRCQVPWMIDHVEDTALEHATGMTEDDFPFCVNKGICIQEVRSGHYFCQCDASGDYTGKRCEFLVLNEPTLEDMATDAFNELERQYKESLAKLEETFQNELRKEQHEQQNSGSKKGTFMNREESNGLMFMVALVTVIILQVGCMVMQSNMRRRRERIIKKTSSLSPDGYHENSGSSTEEEANNSDDDDDETVWQDEDAIEDVTTTPKNTEECEQILDEESEWSNQQKKLDDGLDIEAEILGDEQLESIDPEGGYSFSLHGRQIREESGLYENDDEEGIVDFGLGRTFDAKQSESDGDGDCESEEMEIESQGSDDSDDSGVWNNFVNWQLQDGPSREDRRVTV